MDYSLEWFIHNENIKIFKERLDGATDDAQRKTLLTLLAEEEVKAEQLANKLKANDPKIRGRPERH